MSETWKRGHTNKPIINATTIFTNKLVSNKGVFINELLDGSANDISLVLVEGTVVNNVKCLKTTETIKTKDLKCNTIDMAVSEYDNSYIIIANKIVTRKSAGIYELDGVDISCKKLETTDMSLDVIRSIGSKIIFETDVSFTKYAYTDNIDSSFISSNNVANIHADVSLNKKLRANTIMTEIISKPGDQELTIENDICVNKIIRASDVSASGSGRAHTLTVGDISTSNVASNKITINSDLSFNANLSITDLDLDKIYSLDTDKITLTGDVSINSNLIIGETLSMEGIFRSLGDEITLKGKVTFDNKLDISQIETNRISLHSKNQDSSAIIFDGDVSINGGIYGKMPYLYGAKEVGKFTEIMDHPNAAVGALFILIPKKTTYTGLSLEEFDVRFDSSSVRPDNPPITLYVKKSARNVVKITTLNRDVSWNSVTMRNKITYSGNDICYGLYEDISNEIWSDVGGDDIGDLSYTFDISTSSITGIKNGVRNDDSFNRIYYFDLSANDPEVFDVSYIVASIHDNEEIGTIDFSGEVVIEKYSRIGVGDDVSRSRVKIMTPYHNFTAATTEDLSFNVAAHDNVNYLIKTIYLNVDGNVRPREPSWNEIRVETYDICINSHARHYIDQSWNDSSLNNRISTADTRDVSTYPFDISLNAFFGINKQTLNYEFDLSAVFPETDLDLSYNIEFNAVSEDGDKYNIKTIELSGNRIVLTSNIEDISNIGDAEKTDYLTRRSITHANFNDISVNIVAHNYYQYKANGDASFDFSAAKQDGYGEATIPSDYDVSYSKDASRNILLRVVDVIQNKPPEWRRIQNISISYEGLTQWDASFYSDYSFNYDFDDISASRATMLANPDISKSFIYYIWDTSTSLASDIASLQYKIDLSALDPEGFTVDFSYIPIVDGSYDVSMGTNQLFITTPGKQDPSTNDLSLVIWPQDGGTLSDGSYSDISKNLIFHPFLYKFTEFTFTNCDASGREGPSIDRCREWYNNRYENSLATKDDYNAHKDEYSLTKWWENDRFFDMDTPGIQLWTVPATGLYDVTVAGAGGGRSGGNESVGSGLVMDFSYNFVKGDSYMLLIGQKGKIGNAYIPNPLDGYPSEQSTSSQRPYASSGGGGTFFVKYYRIPIPGDTNAEEAIIDNSANIIAIAGGGSGGPTYAGDDYTPFKTVADGSYNSEFVGLDGSGTANDGDLISTGGELKKEARGGVIAGENEAASGGGGGGGYGVDGGLAGYNTQHSTFNGVSIETVALGAQSFIKGGKGGLNPHVYVNGVINRAGLGSASEGGFGGGGAGAEGGSGGGGGYAGGGSDNITEAAILPKNNTIAGGGGSIVNKEIIVKNANFQSITKQNDNDHNNRNGYIKIKFNPYNQSL